MADEKEKPKSKREKLYGGKDKKPAEKKPDAPKGEDKKAEAAPNPREAMFKRQEGERRDHHNAHRESLRKMAERHEQEINDLQAMQPPAAPLAVAPASPAPAGSEPAPAAV